MFLNVRLPLLSRRGPSSSAPSHHDPTSVLSLHSHSLHLLRCFLHIFTHSLHLFHPFDMRFSNLIAAGLAASPAMVHAAKAQWASRLAQKLGSGACKTQQDYSDDFDAIKSASGATLVRGYAASDCDMAKNALPAAKSKRLQGRLGHLVRKTLVIILTGHD